VGTTRTALQLATDARNRADQKIGAFRDNATVYRYLSESCRSLVSKLITDYQETYWAKVVSAFTTANIINTAIPADVWKVIFLRVTLGDTRDKIDLAAIDDIDNEASSLGGWSEDQWPRCRLMSNSFYWTPIPRAVHTVSVYYAATQLFKDAGSAAIDNMTADTDTFDGIDGWEQWAILDTAVKLRSDEGKDISGLLVELDRRYEEISSAAADRMSSEPERIRDTWRGGDREPWRNGRTW
jgi:hypothetical protein